MNRWKWKNEYTAVLFIAGICANLVIAFLNGILGFVNQAVWQGTLSAYYPGYLIYGVALYAFCKMIAAAINLVKAGRKNSPVLLSMKSIGLVDAMVSILMLEIALIDTFGDINTEWARTMMAVSGFCIWLIAMAVGVFGIRWYIRRK